MLDLRIQNRAATSSLVALRLETKGEVYVANQPLAQRPHARGLTKKKKEVNRKAMVSNGARQSTLLHTLRYRSSKHGRLRLQSIPYSYVLVIFMVIVLEISPCKKPKKKDETAYKASSNSSTAERSSYLDTSGYKAQCKSWRIVDLFTARPIRLAMEKAHRKTQKSNVKAT